MAARQGGGGERPRGRIGVAGITHSFEGFFASFLAARSSSAFLLKPLPAAETLTTFALPGLLRAGAAEIRSCRAGAAPEVSAQRLDEKFPSVACIVPGNEEVDFPCFQPKCSTILKKRARLWSR